MKFGLLIAAVCCVACGSESTAPVDTGATPTSPVGHYVLTDSGAAGSLKPTSGGVMTFTSDSLYTWDRPDKSHAAGHWRGSVDQMTLTDTTEAFVGVWFASLAGHTLTVELGNQSQMYVFSGP